MGLSVARIVRRRELRFLAVAVAWVACSGEAAKDRRTVISQDADGVTQGNGGSGGANTSGGAGAGGGGGTNGTIPPTIVGSAGAAGFSSTQTQAGGTGGSRASGVGGTAATEAAGTTAGSSGTGEGLRDAGVGGRGGTGVSSLSTGGRGNTGGSAGLGGGGIADGGQGTSNPDAGSASPFYDAADSCAVQKAGPFAVRSARSAGFQGTLDAYSGLYKVSCSGLEPCVTTCVAAGGSKDSCTAGSECTSGPDAHCLPPTYWRYEQSALAADGETAEQTLVKTAYQDPLVLRDFGIRVPADASIRGIQFDVLRASLTESDVVDYAVRVLRNGGPVGDDKKLKDVFWPTTLSYAAYGGPDDTWGVSWTPADLANAQFGLSFAALYTKAGGNTRAYVDNARVWITYVPAGCP